MLSCIIMKKTFREQLEVIFRERYRSEGEERIQKRLTEVDNPAARTLITYIQQWPMPSRNQALGRLLEVQRWNDSGELVLEVDFKGKTYPPKAPLELAYESYQYGDQRKQYFPMYSFPSALKCIPDNVTEHWEKEIKGMFHDMSFMSLKAIKIIALGKWVKMLGIGNPHTYAGWQRQVSEWEEAQKAIDAFVVNRKGWEYLTSENIQKPIHREEMSKVLEEILFKADEVVEPSFAAIKEQDRRLYIGQDATHARNNVKSLMKFFKKYGEKEDNIFIIIGELIDQTERNNLAKKTI